MNRTSPQSPRSRRPSWLLAAVGLALLPSRATATVPDMFGLGSANVGMGGGVTARADDPYAAYYNPAGLTQIGRPMFAGELILGQFNLRPFQGIVYDTNGDGLLVNEDGGPDYGPIGTDYRVHPEGDNSRFATAGLVFGGSIPLRSWLAIGMAGFLPAGGLARVELQDPYLPHYVMFRGQNDRLAVHPALAIKPLHDLHLGVGAQVMTAAETYVRATMHADIDAFPSGSGGQTSGASSGEIRAHVVTQIDDLSISLRYRATPCAGLLFNLGAFVAPEDPSYEALKRFGAGIAYRGSWSVPTRTDVVIVPSGGVRFNDQLVVLSDLAHNPIALRLDEPVAFYEPAQLAFGLKGGWGRVDVAGDVTWSDWSRYRELVLPNRVITIGGIAGLNADVETGRPVPKEGFHDTWTWRMGAAFALGEFRDDLFDTVTFKLRGGFAFVPSPVSDQTGLTNFMDSDRRVVTGGVGIELARIAGLTGSPVRLDAAFQYHSLKTRTVSKDRALLQDKNGDGVIDYPYGYPLEGKITSAGSAWALSLGFTMALDQS